MHADLLNEIDKFMAERGLGEHRFGFLAVKNGRLVERLRAGRPIWPHTEMKVRAYMLSERRKAAPSEHGEAA